MRLNLPFSLKGRRVLIAGIGGGWDIYGALPLVQAWRDECRLTLANLSSMTSGFDLRVAGEEDVPEQLLAKLIGEQVYVLGKEGVASVRSAYLKLIDRYSIDAIVLLDGGVDSLMRCDEQGPGTILLDSISLAAIDSLPVATKILACLGFGTETDEGVCHFRVLENMAALAREDAVLGGCMLTRGMVEFQFYESICLRAFATPVQRSHIHTRVIPAVRGEFGRYEMYHDKYQPLELLAERPPWISPLMAWFWFYNADEVRRRNLLVPWIKDTETFADVEVVYERVYPSLRANMRPNRDIPY